MSDGTVVLSYAVRPRVVARYLGQLAFLFAVLLVAPLALGLGVGDYRFALANGGVIFACLIAAALASRLPAPKQVQTNEALTTIALAFLLASLLCGVTLMGTGLDPSAALFEGISAVTTTGLTTIADVGNRSPAFHFARAWMQWFGGLGFVVLLVALLAEGDIATKRLTEPYGGDTMLTTTRTHARRMLRVYLGLTACGLVFAWIAAGNGFVALVHVLSAVSTGGFSSYDESLGGMGSWTARYVLIGIAMLGAIPLPLYLLLGKKKRAFSGDPEVRALILGVASVGILLAALLRAHGGYSGADSALHGLLMGISAQTTTGFATIAPDDAGSAGKLLMIVAMFIGGGLGSTAGGIKLLRLLVVLRLTLSMLRRASLPPHALVGEPRIGSRKVSDDDLRRVVVLILLYVGLVLLSWAAFLVYDHTPLDSLFEVVSAVGTVGLSTGITNSDLHPFLKVVLGADMLLGRLEILAFAVLLYPRNWLGRRASRE